MEVSSVPMYLYLAMCFTVKIYYNTMDNTILHIVKICINTFCELLLQVSYVLKSLEGHSLLLYL